MLKTLQQPEHSASAAAAAFGTQGVAAGTSAEPGDKPLEPTDSLTDFIADHLCGNAATAFRSKFSSSSNLAAGTAPPPAPATAAQQLTPATAAAAESAVAAAAAAAAAEESAAAAAESAAAEGGDAEEPDSLTSMLPQLPRWSSMKLHRKSWLPSMPRGSSSSRSLKTRMAEHLVGVQVVSAADSLWRNLLQGPDPLPAAVIKLLRRTAGGAVLHWAYSNANKVFIILGCYVCATCAAFSAAKRLLKACVRRLPALGGFKLIQPLSFATDRLLPTGFCGPYLAAYIAVKLVLQAAMDREAAHKAKVAAAATQPTSYDPFDSDNSSLQEAERETYDYHLAAALGAQGAAVGPVSPASRRSRAAAAHTFSQGLKTAQLLRSQTTGRRRGKAVAFGSLQRMSSRRGAAGR